MSGLKQTDRLPGGPPPGSLRLRSVLGPRPLLQCVIALGIVAVIYLLGVTLTRNMAQSGIVAGFGFLDQPANFEIGESLIAYSSQSSFGRAILVGLLNTLSVSLAGCLLAILLGVAWTMVVICSRSPPVQLSHQRERSCGSALIRGGFMSSGATMAVWQGGGQGHELAFGQQPGQDLPGAGSRLEEN